MKKIFICLKKYGSNFLIKDRTVLFEPRSAWRTLLDSGLFGGNSEQTALRADHIFGSEADFDFWRKEWDSNPRGACAPSRFRIGAVMTTSVPFLGV